MARYRERETNCFEVADDDGNSYIVIELQQIATRNYLGGSHVVPGIKRLVLSTGEHVNPRKDGSFQIFETCKIVRKIG
jgi:hypothetical protein